MGLSDVIQPIESARGLPNEHYVCPQMFAREREALFFKNWSAIAFESDVAKPGDAFPVEFLGIPLLVVRAKNGCLLYTSPSPRD